ncbi:MAG: hypothetical protein U9N59_11650 [Campylobacterota bacterium]|nr:hypothetical protein [Campylobacterota bacterium]
MKLKQAIDKYFTQEKLVDSICKYQLYYQLGLGNIVFQTIKDLDETHKKLEELNLQIDSNKVFESIHEIVLHLSSQDDFDDKFDKHLRFTAFAQMLNDFVEADKGLLNAQPFTDIVYEKIKDDTYFDEKMEEQFNLDFEAILPVWQETITEDIAIEIKDVVLEIIPK